MTGETRDINHSSQKRQEKQGDKTLSRRKMLPKRIYFQSENLDNGWIFETNYVRMYFSYAHPTSLHKFKL